MLDLKELISRFAHVGQVEWIGVRPERRSSMQHLEQAQVLERGVEGDHGASEKRAVTLMQAEHLPVIAAFMKLPEVRPDTLRRNVLVSGLNLAALKGRRIAIGTSVLEVTGVCAPCSRMEQALGHGGYSAMRGHGGWCARVVATGEIAVGNSVRPLAKET